MGSENNHFSWWKKSWKPSVNDPVKTVSSAAEPGAEVAVVVLVVGVPTV